MNLAHQYVFGKELCNVPSDLLSLMDDKIDYYNQNVIPNFERKLSTYRQWHLQDSDNRWIDSTFEIVEDFFKQYVTNIFRFRLSVLQPDNQIDWHAAHQTARIHIPLRGSSSCFAIRDFMGIKKELIPMEYGKAYMINVAFPHSVQTVSSVRYNAFFCFEEFATEDLTKEFTAT